MELLDPADPSHSNHLISTRGRRVARVWHHDTPLLEVTQNQLILDWNRTGYEQCGFIDSEQNLWYIPNVHEKPRWNFLMEVEETKRVLEYIYAKEKNSVLGIFHTHPNNVTWPSPRDIVGWPNPALRWRYFIVIENEIVEWALEND